MGRVPIHLKIGDTAREVEVHVLRGMKAEFLLGLDNASDFNLSLNLSTLKLNPNTTFLPSALESRAFAVENRNFAEGESLTPNQQQALNELLETNKSIFSTSQTDIGSISTEHHSISLTNNVPIHRSPYRSSQADRAQIEKQVESLLSQGFIRPSLSPYAAPVILAEKKGEGRTRMCIDYRKLNAITIPDYQPIPRIDDVLDSLGSSKYFTALDITSGYWHVPMKPEDIHKTAFVTPTGHYEWLVMPFGLKNAPATFQRAMKTIIAKHNLRNVVNYFDDIVVHAPTFEEHLTHLEALLHALKAENVKLKFKKCQFARTSIDYLGHTISNGKTSPKKSNVAAIQNFPKPQNVKDLQRFLGTVNVYKQYIDHFSDITLPLTELLKKDVQWQWSAACDTAFRTLRDKLTEAPVLHIFDPSRPCTVLCDASLTGIGAVLKQRGCDGKDHPVAYHSRKIQKHEANYTVTELECLAIIDAVDKWHCYLHGNPFTVVTDHSALQWLKTMKNPTGRLFRWSLKLSTYDATFKYQPGSDNIEADALSRSPIVSLLSARELQNTPCDLYPGTYRTENGIPIVRKRGLRKIYVPLALRRTILEKAHQEFGHVGVRKTLSLISAQYYWRELTTDVSNFIRHCDTCQRCKKTKLKRFGLLESLPPAEKPFDLIAMDTIGGLSGYGSPKKFIHLVVDHATRYAWAFAHKNETANAYISCLREVFTAGVPRRFLSDRGTGFTANNFKRFLKNHNVHQLFTSTSHPQCNGLNERTNQTIVNRLKCKIQTEPRTPWPRLLIEVIAEYNRTPHEVTQFPPSYLMHGVVSYPHHITDNLPTLEDARKLAVRHSLDYHRKNKVLYDKRFLPGEFATGDAVLYETPWHPNRGKLSPVMEGPYTVLKKVSPVNYEIDRPVLPIGRQTDVVHISKLRLYHPPIAFNLGGGGV